MKIAFDTNSLYKLCKVILNGLNEERKAFETKHTTDVQNNGSFLGISYKRKIPLPYDEAYEILRKPFDYWSSSFSYLNPHLYADISFIENLIYATEVARKTNGEITLGDYESNLFLRLEKKYKPTENKNELYE